MRKQHMVEMLAGIGRNIYIIALTAISAFTFTSCESEEGSPMTSNTPAKVLQLILDHEEVQQYLHPDVENRVPIQISTNNLIPDNISINKFDKPVEFASKAQQGPHFEIIRYEQSKDSVEFIIRYDVEGLSVSGNAVIEGTAVQLMDLDVIEN